MDLVRYHIEMPQFPVTPERQRILKKIPDYEVRIGQAEKSVRVSISGEEIARSTVALLVAETRHADVFYLPRTDIRMELLVPTDHRTFCPFKGYASYWSYGDEENIAWSYEDPFEEVARLRNYLSFYPDRTTIEVT